MNLSKLCNIDSWIAPFSLFGFASNFIVLVSDEYRLDFHLAYTCSLWFNYVKYKCVIKLVFNPDITLQSEEAIAT